MIDKKRTRNKVVCLANKNTENNGITTSQCERKLLSHLIDCSHELISLHSFGNKILNLLNKHPVLQDKSMAIWKYNLDSINIIAPNNLPNNVQQELRETASLNKKWRSLTITHNPIKHSPTLNTSSRIDISIEKENNNLFYFSFWSNLSKEDLNLLTPFLRDFLGISKLCLKNLFSKQQTKLLNTILEKAVDSVEITNKEAVIQYVNPAFEKITQYKASEALNKTVASLSRSPKDNMNLFANIQQVLDAGNTWRGRINSRKKDGSDWVAQTVIVPIIDEESGQIDQHIAIKQDITEQIKYLNQLKNSEERYRNLMNAASDAIFIHNLDGLFIETNSAACKSLGYIPEELCQLHVWDVEVGISKEGLNQLWLDLQDGPVTVEGRHKRKDGTIFPVDVHLGIFNDTDHKLVVAIVRDVSEQKQSQATIRRLTRALEQSPVLVLITDKSGAIEYVNAKALEQTGYHPNEILGKNARILQSGQTPPDIYKLMWNQLTQGQEWRGELLNKNKNGELFWVSTIISPVRGEEEEITHYLAVMEDISQKKHYEDMLKYQASYDNLTNLPNRFYGYNRLEQAIANARLHKNKLAILFLDLNEFKKINDSLGHAEGDLLLKAISERYLSIIRQTDTIARLGGDEFMMILENLNYVSDAELIAKKCYEVCLQPFIIESQELLVSSSIGIAIFPEHGKDAKTLMRNADLAMYQNKINGKVPWTIYTNTMAKTGFKHAGIKSELYKALSREELYLCYQPIMDIKNNELVAAEALLRWHSSTMGNILPDQIIPIAEETGLIIELGYWILKKACAQVKEWQMLTHKNLKVAINISTIQLKQENFVDKVKAILEETNVTPESLIFEVTESAFIDDSNFILSQLKKLNGMNIHCSLEDFGMRYSTLNSLRYYPFKSLKIDRTFIQGANSSSNELNLVNSIIAMSRALKLTVVAEGIETEEQLRLMRSLNCDMVQGWYFSEPLSMEHFSSYLREQSE